MITVMNHSVGLEEHPWFARHVAESAAEFDLQCSVYRAMKFHCVFMKEAWERQKEENLLFLNFDDGYLDNWVHVLPILQYYGLKGTTYVSADFIDPREIIRPQKTRDESVNTGKDHKAPDCCAGFLSWPEMRAMEKSGVMEIQAHAQTHTWYIKGPRVTDFWKPGSATEKDGPIWMLWNRFVDTKPFYLTDAPKQETSIPYGTPVFENEKSLAVVRFFPEEKALADLSGKLADWVQTHGGKDLFTAEPAWREQLTAIVNQFGEVPGRYETEAERLERVRTELSVIKERLEKNLNKEVRGLCWPGGGVTEQVVRIARSLGYEYFTMPSRWRLGNCPDSCKNMLPRYGTPRFISACGKNLKLMNRRDLSLYLWMLDHPSGFRKNIWRIRQILAMAGL